MCSLYTHTHTHAGLCVKESIKQIPVYSVGITEQREVRGQTGLHSHIDLTFTSLSSICDTVLCVICVFMCVCVWFGTYWSNQCVFIHRIVHSEMNIFHNLFTFPFFIQGEARFSELFLFILLKLMVIFRIALKGTKGGSLNTMHATSSILSQDLSVQNHFIEVH